MNNMKNFVQLIGRLGADPEVKTVNESRKLARFTVATNDYYNDKNGQKQQDTQWHSIVAWGRTAELVEKHLQKGSEVVVTGKLVHRSYEDLSGTKKYVSEIVMREFIVTSKKKVGELVA